MSYLKKILSILIISLIASIISYYLGFYNFGWVFVLAPVVLGIILVLIQKETVSYKFLDKLVLGALVYGFITVIYMTIKIYLFSRQFYTTIPYSFFVSFNFLDQLWVALALAFLCLLGGLLGIVVKGFYEIFRLRSR